MKLKLVIAKIKEISNLVINIQLLVDLTVSPLTNAYSNSFFF